MKRTTTLIVLLLAVTGAAATGSHSTKGYTRKNGSYVAPHRSTNPDHSRSNNWSHKGNVNPYTGREGTKK